MAKLIWYIHPRDAIEDYHAAIEYDKNFGVSQYGPAMAHSELGEYDLIIDAMHRHAL